MLAAPIINGTLPAFYVEDGTAKIAVPFSMSRAVNKSEVIAFHLKIKNVQGSTFLKTLRSTNIDFVNSVVYFSMLESELTNFYVGSFYKAQLAYEDTSKTVGYYSTVGVTKYTTRPKVDILGMEESANNGHIYSYTGTYSQKGKDKTEKVYSYCFTILDETDNIIEDTGWIVHNNSTDTNPYESSDSFFFARDLKEGEKFKIVYKIRTNNGLELSSPSYRITSKKSIQSNLANAKLNLSLNFDNAYIQISLSGEKDNLGYELPVKGYYILSRASELTSYTQWEEIERFTLAAQKPSKKSWKDFTIQQGMKYKYSIQQYNDKGLFSERILSDEIYADFEHSYLFDGERQLKIMFNPKVTSFKIDRQEAKIETIGSKFPFIFRNGNVEYKEFPISGLISYQTDEEGLFIDNTELFKEGLREAQYVYKVQPVNSTNYASFINRLFVRRRSNYVPVRYIYATEDKFAEFRDQKLDVTHNKVFNKMVLDNEIFYIQFFKDMSDKDFDDYKIKSFDLTSQNISLEREFKLKVLEWLSNGKPKLFKSPTEGNYLVRLMNVNLSPNDQVGRMLHSFSSTAYEIAENNYDSQLKYGIINTDIQNENIYLKISSIPLATTDKNYTEISHVDYYTSYNESDTYFALGELVPLGITVENFSIEDVPPGTELLIDSRLIVVGATGAYHSPIPVSSIKVPPIKVSIPDRDTFERSQQSLFYFDDNAGLYKKAIAYTSGRDYYSLQPLSGAITMSYYTTITNSFNTISNTFLKDVYAKQFIGYHENIKNEIENVSNNIISFYNIKAYNRPLEEYYMVEAMEEIVLDTPIYQERYYDFYVLNENYNNEPGIQTGDTGIANMDIANDGIAIAAEPPAYVGDYDPDLPVDEEDGEDESILFDEGVNQQYLPAEWYSPDLTYYVKVQKYYSKVSNKEIFTIYKFIFSGDGYLFTNNINKLCGYYINQHTISGLEMPMYKKAKFMNVGNSDRKGLNPNRDLENRTSSNPLIMDIQRDYPILVQAGQLFYFDTEKQGNDRVISPVLIDMPYTDKDNIVYLLAEESFKEIFDPVNIWQKYISTEDYNDVCDFLKLYNEEFLNSFRNTYEKWDTRVEINSRVFDLTDSKYHFTEVNDNIYSYLIGAGSYCEAYYQKQEIDYDISKISSLQKKKAVLDEYDNILSREYMRAQCVSDADELIYIQDTQRARANYKEKYDEYIAELEAYLKSLEQEG